MSNINDVQIIKDSAGSYKKWALEARKKYIELRMRQGPEISKLYKQMATSISRELNSPYFYGSKLREKHLVRLEKALILQTVVLEKGLEGAISRDVREAINAGVTYSHNIALKVTEGIFEPSNIARLYTAINADAVNSYFNRTINGMNISKRIWDKSQQAQNAIKQICRAAVVSGEDAITLADMVTKYVNEDRRTFAYQYPNMMKRMGSIPGNLCYESLRLARTEMAFAFGESTKLAAQATPGYIGMKWGLANTHPAPDICDDYANHDEGLGIGIYSPGNEETIPAHPNCLCWNVPVYEDMDSFIKRLNDWEKDPLSEPDIDHWYQEVYLKQNAYGQKDYFIKHGPVVPKVESVRKATKWAQNNIKVDHIDYKGFNVKVANEFNEELYKLQSDYPEIMETIKWFGTAQDRNKVQYKLEIDWYVAEYKKRGLSDERALYWAKQYVKKCRVSKYEYASALRTSNPAFQKIVGIAFNKQHVKDYETFSQSIERDVRTGFHPEGTTKPAAILTHEFGHVLYNYLRQHGQTHWVQAMYKAFRRNNSGVEAGSVLSRYALENDDEFFAEAFAEYRHNEKPRETAELFGRNLEKAVSNLKKEDNK